MCTHRSTGGNKNTIELPFCIKELGVIYVGCVGNKRIIKDAQLIQREMYYFLLSPTMDFPFFFYKRIYRVRQNFLDF